MVYINQGSSRVSEFLACVLFALGLLPLLIERLPPARRAAFGDPVVGAGQTNGYLIASAINVDAPLDLLLASRFRFCLMET